MSTPFLLGYASSLITSLITRDLIEIRDGSEAQVVVFLAEFLDSQARGGSLLSSTVRALLSCPEVDELYADDEELKDVVETLVYER